MESGSGLEVFRNEKFEVDGSVGYYTEKRYHLAKNFPSWLQSILGPKLTILTEKSWNLYPNLFTKYYNDVFPNAEFSLQTDSLETLEFSENALNLSQEDLNKRQVILVDLTKFCKLKNYDPMYDPLRSNAAPYLPLKPDWFKDPRYSGIVSYKLLRLNVPFFGMLSSKIESYVVNFFHENLIYYTCMGLCSYDKWNPLTLETLRLTEVECYDKMNEVFKLNYAKKLEKTLRLAPGNLSKGEKIVLPEVMSRSLASQSTHSPSYSPTTESDPLPNDQEQSEEEPLVLLRGDHGVEVQRKSKPHEAVVHGELKSLTTDETYGSLTVDSNFVEDKVVLDDSSKDLPHTALEFSGPVPVSYSDSEFYDALEEFPEVEPDQEEKSFKVLSRKFSNVFKFSFSRPSQPAEGGLQRRVPSFDRSTQTLTDLEDSPHSPSDEVSLDQLHVVKSPPLDQDHLTRELASGLSLNREAGKGVGEADPKSQGSVQTTSSNLSDSRLVPSPKAPSTRSAVDKRDNFSYDIPLTFTGFLYKLGRGFSSWTWKLRYIIVCGFNLYYFDRKSDMRPKDTINLKNSRISWTGNHMSRPFVFSITTAEKQVYYWSADEEETVKRWILLLQVLCEESPPSIVKQLAYELTYHQKNAHGLPDYVTKP